MKINSLQIENVKRVKAVTLEPTPNGLTVIGGKNGQGKTSILDAIAWALGGDRFRPSSAQREDSVIPPFIRVRMDNGLVVERRGKNSDLYVTDPSGKRAGQQLLNTFVEQLALDLPRFMQQSSREKAETLLNILGIGPTLAELNRQERSVYDQRRAVGQIADQKMKYAREQPFYPDTPDAPVSASELIRQQQEILARNGEHQRLRAKRDELKALVDRLSREQADVARRLEAAVCDLSLAQKDAADLQDESTAELEQSIRNVEEINARVRANLDREKAEEDAREYRRQYDGLTGQLEEVRQQKAALLDGAALPLPGLSVRDGELCYQGKNWDCMSASDQLIVSTAIVRRLNPNCGFVLLDKLEQLDPDTMARFGAWLQEEGLQAIATRVSTNAEECTLIISDGAVGENEKSGGAGGTASCWGVGQSPAKLCEAQNIPANQRKGERSEPRGEDSGAKGSLSTERGQTVPALGPELHGPNEFGTRNRTAPQPRSPQRAEGVEWAERSAVRGHEQPSHGTPANMGAAYEALLADGISQVAPQLDPTSPRQWKEGEF